MGRRIGHQGWGDDQYPSILIGHEDLDLAGFCFSIYIVR